MTHCIILGTLECSAWDVGAIFDGRHNDAVDRAVGEASPTLVGRIVVSSCFLVS